MYSSMTNITIETSSICNAKCKICPNYDKSRLHHLMNLDDFEKILKLFPKLNSLSLCGLYEPLLDHRLSEIFDVIKKVNPNMSVTIFSNGSMLNKWKNLLLYNNNLSSIIFSIHGFSLDTYNNLMINLNRDLTYNNIIHFVNERNSSGRNKPRIAVSFVRTSENLHELNDFKEFWKYKVDDVHNFELMNWNNTVTKYDNLIDKPKLQPRKCPMYNKPMVIDAFGNVVRCCYNLDFTYGNVFKDGITKYLEKKRESDTYPDFDCINCDGWKV